jgi:hypothetical protein
MRKRLLAIAVLLALVAPSLFAVTSPDTYIVSVSGQPTTAAILLSIESSSTLGFRLLSWCADGISNATAAAAVTVTVQRRTTAASSGGTLLTNEGTGTTAVTKVDPLSPNFPGIARLNGTPGTAGAVIDQRALQVATGFASQSTPICQDYINDYARAPSIPAGVVNGVSINISAVGAGGISSGTITALIALGQ